MPGSSQPTLLLTRPAKDNPRVLQALRDAGLPNGIRVVMSPVLEIAHVSIDVDISGSESLIFTSRNGVQALSAANSGIIRPCHVVGARTGAAATEAGHLVLGVYPDAAALLDHLLQTPPPTPVYHIRGTFARGDIAKTLKSHGIDAFEVIAYEQTPLPLNAEARALMSGDQPVIIPLFSPRSAAQLSQDWSGVAPIHGVALSPAVALAAKNLEWVTLNTTSSPDLKAMVTSVIDTLRDLSG